jgi:mRNA-degrading endonuclease toxin of MazEF toxin-antitoxin module
LQLGSVLWAELEVCSGYRKVRPVVVVSPTADIKAGKPMRVVVIATRLPDPLVDDHVSLPWDRQAKARGIEAPVCGCRNQAGGNPVRAAQQ